MMRTILCFLASLALLGAPPAVETAFRQGLDAYAAEDYDRAMKLFEQAVEAEPKNSKYHLWYGRATGRRAERVIFFRAIGLAKKVGASFERAVELDPRSIEALNDLLEFYLQAPGMVGGGEDKAPPVAEKLARLSAAEGHRARAKILEKRKEYAAAEQELRKALELEPEKVGRVLELASFLADRGRHDEAEALFERAAKLAPDSPEYLYARGKYLARTRRNPGMARALLQQYLQSPRKPDDPPASEVRKLLEKLG